MTEDIFLKVKSILGNDPFSIDEKIEINTKLKSLPGWDSFKHLTFIITIESEFEIELGSEAISEIEVVNDIVLAVDEVFES